MSTNFGDSYRKDVEDINEGRGQAAPVNQVGTVQRASTGREVTTLDTRDKFRGFTEFASEVTKTAVGIGNRKEQEALDRAYAEGSQEKLDAIQKNEGLFYSIFGKSTLRKGFENRVIDNEVEKDYQNRLQTIALDAQKYKTIEEYRENVGDPLLQTALDKQSDPDVKARITKAFTHNTKLLSNQFIKHRAAYEQVLNRKQVLTNVLSVTRSMELAAATGDPDLMNDAKTRVGKAIQKPRTMEQKSWEATMTIALVDRIGNGDLSLLQVMEVDGKLDNFDTHNKNKIDEAKDVYTRQNDTRFLTKGFDLEAMISRQDKNFEPALAAYKRQYPQVNVNQFRARFEVARQKATEKAQQLHQDKLDILSGNTIAAPKDSVRKMAAARAAEDQIADDAARMELGEQIRQQQLNGELPESINKVFTQQEKEAAQMRSPEGLVNMWRTSGVAPTLVTKSMHELDNLILSDELTAEDEPRIKQLTQFLNAFNENPNDAALFAKGLKSKQQLANFKQLNFLMNSTGRAARESIVMMRLNRKKDTPEFDAIQSQEYAAEALREFTDANGFENWLGWSTDPDNQEELELAATTAFEEALEIVKNPAEAKNLVQDFLTFTSTRIGDKFVLGGADLDTNSYGGNFNEYVQVIQVSEAWKSKQAVPGFPRDRLITDERNAITVFPNKQGVVITSKNKNNNTIYVDLPVPKNEYDWTAAQPPRRPSVPMDFNEPVPPAVPFIDPQTQQVPTETNDKQAFKANIPKGKTATLAIKNNNPGNLRALNIPFEGKTGEVDTGSGKFSTFKSPEFGMRALARDLDVKIKRGVNTVEKIIKVFSPDADPENIKRGFHSQAYINFVSKRTGFPVDKILTPADRAVLMEAITAFESGFQPWSKQLIAEGIRLADK